MDWLYLIYWALQSYTVGMHDISVDAEIPQR